MAILFIPDEDKSISNPKDIKQYLSKKGVHYDQWEAKEKFSSNADQETVLKAYEHVLEPYMKANGYTTADVINVTPETPGLDEIKAKFLKEHTHTEDEVRFFVDGEGYFWFNLEDGGPVFCVLCQQGDLISVPANSKHWFDMGEKSNVKAIRMFIDKSGWVPHYTESDIDKNYVSDELKAS